MIVTFVFVLRIFKFQFVVPISAFVGDGVLDVPCGNMLISLTIRAKSQDPGLRAVQEAGPYDLIFGRTTNLNLKSKISHHFSQFHVLNESGLRMIALREKKGEER